MRLCSRSVREIGSGSGSGSGSGVDSGSTELGRDLGWGSEVGSEAVCFSLKWSGGMKQRRRIIKRLT